MNKRSGFTTHQSKTPVHGFTLIEILIVVSVISILSTVGFITYQGIAGRTKDARMKADVDTIKVAYEANYDPTSNNGQGGYKILSGSNFTSGEIPITPQGKNYIISRSNDGSDFMACAYLTNKSYYCKSSVRGSAVSSLWCNCVSADINNDRRVNSADYGIIASVRCYGNPVSNCPNPKADINGDGMVNDTDYNCFRTQNLLGCEDIYVP